MIAIPVTAAHADPGHAGSGPAGFSHSRPADFGHGRPGGFKGSGHGPQPGHHFGHRHHHPHPYTGGAPTFTRAFAAPGVVGQPEHISVDVASKPGFEQPTGTVDVTVSGPGGYSWTGTADVTGSWVSFTADAPTTEGYYAVSVNYAPGDDAFKASGTYTGFFAADQSATSPWSQRPSL